jgi:hypothetical protein
MSGALVSGDLASRLFVRGGRAGIVDVDNLVDLDIDRRPGPVLHNPGGKGLCPSRQQVCPAGQVGVQSVDAVDRLDMCALGEPDVSAIAKSL